jgi:hypothetical protein
MLVIGNIAQEDEASRIETGQGPQAMDGKVGTLGES